MLARSRWSISTAIRGALVIFFSVCVCVLCLFLSHAFSNFQMSQSGPPKLAPATCLVFVYLGCPAGRYAAPRSGDLGYYYYGPVL